MSTVTPNVPLLPGAQMFAMRALIVVIFGVYCVLGLPAALTWLYAHAWTRNPPEDFAAAAGLIVLGATACRWLFYRLYLNAERALDADLPADAAAERRRDRFVRRYYWLGGHLWRAHRVRNMSPAEFDVRARRHALEIWLSGIGTAAVLTLAFLQLKGPSSGFVQGFAVAVLITLAGTIWTWYWPVARA